MLVLIVVSAALALAAFIQTEEKANLAARAVQEQRTREVLNVTSLALRTNSSADVNEINVSVANTGTELSYVSSVDVNGIPVQNLTLYDLLNGTSYPVGCEIFAMGKCTTRSAAALANFTLAAGEQAFLWIDTSTLLSDTSFVAPSVTPFLPDSFLKVNVWTAYDNDFLRAFVPPVAFGYVTSVLSCTSTSSPCTQELIYDGALSHAQNDTVVSWTWQTEPSPCLPGPTCWLPTGGGSGEEVPIPTGVTSPGTYVVQLTVADTTGLTASMQFPFNYT